MKFIKRKNIIKKLAFILSITLLLQLSVFDLSFIRAKAATWDYTGFHSSDRTFDSDLYDEWRVPANREAEVEGTLEIKGEVTLTVESGATFIIGNDLVIDGNVTINNSGTIVVNHEMMAAIQGTSLTVNNSGTFTINGVCEIDNVNIVNSGTFKAHSFDAVRYTETDGIIFYKAEIHNSGMLTTGVLSTWRNYFIRNEGNGKYLVNGIYYETDNLNLNLDISTPDSVVESGAYIEKATIKAPSGWRISFLESDNYANLSDTLTITTSQAGKHYYLYDSNSYRTEGGWLDAITIRNKAVMPSTKYTITSSEGTGAKSYYFGPATISAPSGYKICIYTFTTPGGWAAPQTNFICGSETSGVSSYTFTGNASGMRAYLFDADGLRTNDSFDLPDMNIVNPEYYEIIGEETETNEYPNGCYIAKAEINAINGYKICLASDSSKTEQSKIVIDKTMKNVKLYCKDVANGKTEWYGPFDIGDVNIKDKADMPEVAYTLSGTKYKEKKYQSDVVLKPAEGFKVTTDKSKEAVSSITFSKTTKDVKIYLVDEYGLYTDEIKVGDIYILRKGKGEVSVEAECYGGKLSVKATSDNFDPRTAKFAYKTADGKALTGAPTAVGKYTVEATFPDNDNYQEYTAKAEFEIKYLPSPTVAYTIEGQEGKEDFYITDVQIVAPDGYFISKTLGSGYAKSLMITGEEKEGFVYLKKLKTGEMTDKIRIKGIKIDKSAPKIEGIKDGENVYGDNIKITISDEYLEELIVNGKPVEFKGKSVTYTLDPEGGYKEYEIITKDKAGNINTVMIVVTAEWMKTGKVLIGKIIKLYPGKTYSFPEGKETYQIPDDPTVYYSGNNFVVKGNIQTSFN